MAERLTIAMTGLAQSGKDTVGDHLAEVHGFAKEAFADDVRKALYGINPPVMNTGEATEAGNTVPVEMLADFVDRVGWDIARRHPLVSGLLRRTGTEGGWMIHGDNLWIDRVERRADALPKGVPLVITDCRTPQEIAWVRRRGGFVYRVDRVGQTGISSELSGQDSEGNTIEHDFLIVNNGSLGSLRAQVDAVLEMTIGRRKVRR